MPETMTYQIFEDIPFEPDLPWFMKRLRLKEGSANHAELQHMLEIARPIARPRAVYLVAYIDQKGDDWVNFGGQHFTSRVLRVNLENTYRVFPYLATCGPELQEWAASMDDMLMNFWAEAVKEAALYDAIRVLSEDMDARYQVGHTATMNPGSLKDWPIQEQVPLFNVFGSRAQEIGVQLNDSLLMMPTKSVSGIRFTTQADFESCQLCPRDGCPGRRAVYDPDLYDARYCRQNGLAQDQGL
jgi:hypothetical protein